MAKQPTGKRSTSRAAKPVRKAKRDRLAEWAGPHREAAAFYKRTGRILKLLTVQEILDEEHVQKM